MRQSEVITRFLKYVSFDTQSSEESSTFPSTEKQKDLGRALFAELTELGASDVYFDEEKGYVYAKLPASPNAPKDTKTLAFLAHMDTSPSVSGKNVRPRFTEHYDGGDIMLDEKTGTVLSPREFPELKGYVGQTLITTDGTTLLGADDKAGVAEIMTMAHQLLSDDSKTHGPIAICFTPDEEVGGGVDYIDLSRLNADYAFTVDGGALGELEYENFNAAFAKVEFHGKSVHPGDAKGKMKNAALFAIEFANGLPENERPETTEGYEGFYFLEQIKGDCENASLLILIRDHDREKSEEKKSRLNELAEAMNDRHGAGTVELTIEDSYYNMKEKIEPENLFLIDLAKQSMEKLQITPKLQPIRGGTDGARLSFMGLPCPNLCTGGHNFHGRYEYIPVESMERITELLVEIACGFAEQS